MSDGHLTTRATIVLKVVLVLQCVGALGVALSGSGLFAQAGTALALVAALAVASGRMPLGAYVVAAWFGTAAVLQTVEGTVAFGYLAVPAHAIRIGVALAVVWPERASTILRVGTALTFAAHGLEALGLHPQFVEYIQHTGALVGWKISATNTMTMLRVIGAVDWLVALSLLVPGPRVYTSGYMAVWGTITAFARTVYAGPAGLPETLIRAAHAGGPLGLLLDWRERSASPETAESSRG